MASRSSTSTQPCSSWSAALRAAPANRPVISASPSIADAGALPGAFSSDGRALRTDQAVLPYFAMTSGSLIPPSLADLETLAQRALATVPDELKRHLGPVVIRVDDFPDEETEDEMGLESPFDILGLYRGVA